jgi:hypothetical protein
MYEIRSVSFFCCFSTRGNSLMQPSFQSLHMDLLIFQHQSIACLSKKSTFKEVGEK